MPDAPDDPELLNLLDAYLQQIQSGQRPDRGSFLREHPELASMLSCLDALESMAIPSGQHHLDQITEAFSAEEVSVPREFGAYELLGEIGRGGMGVVYKARQHGLERLVAVKMILASHLASPDHVRRFQDEARAAAGLRHPNIVHIHDVGQCNGQHFFTMEYIEGQSLAEHIAQGPAEIDTAARLVAKVARAVHHLHQHGIVHRDLKPSNILLDGDGEPFVTDFGLAKFFTADSKVTATGVIAGTPCYMAPEQASGQGRPIGPACDVYSLGAILYELLTGRPPFREENPLDTLLQVLGGEAQPPRELNHRVPRELEWICLKCLARSPDDRYPSAAALADDLDRFLKKEVLEARPPGFFERLWSWTRREPALASRLFCLGTFYVVDLVNLATGVNDPDFHWKITTIIALWIASAVFFQQFLKSGRWSIPARLFWGLLDSILLLAMLLVANGVASPLVVGYFLLIVAAGLWYRVRFVWVMTGLSLISYGVLVFDWFQWRSAEFGEKFGEKFGQSFSDEYSRVDRHVIFVLALLATAAVTAYLVARIRALSGYFGQKV